MKPIEVWGQRAAHWTRASLQRLDGWRIHADVRLGTVGATPLRRWLASVAIAAAGVCVAAALLHVLLLAALRSGAGPGWLAVGVVAAIAVILLLAVLRDTVVSLVAPQRRRAHLLALLASAAALLAGVQACAAATVAIAGPTQGLWQAEQLYAWHLVDSVPLLAIPTRLEWSQPIVTTGAGDRAILVAFTVALIVPLARIVVAIYHLTGGHGMPESDGAMRTRWVRRPSIPILPKVRLPRSGIAIPLVAAGGFIWGGLGRGTALGARIAATSGSAFVGAVAAATLGAILITVLLSIVMGVVKVLWEPISDGPWMQLALAAGLVWIDTPVRQMLLPDLSALWKLVVMLGLWAVLTILLLPVWVDPQLPESLLALGLLLGFAGSGAPGGEHLVAALTWTPGGFAIGPAFSTALACLTGAYLAYLLSQAAARAANAGRLHATGSIDLRRELGGYLSIGVQVITAAAGALMLLYGLGAAGSTSAAPIGAPRSLLAVAWHVADSMPGPDIPAVAGWRLATDFTGRWAGAVAVVTVATLIIVVAFPMIRATLRWAKLKPGQQSPERPLAEVPSDLLMGLEIVRAFLTESSQTEGFAAVRGIGSSPELTDEQRESLAKMHEAEERLSAAEVDRGKLRDLLGEDSPVYWAADRAVAESVDAYRTVVRTQVSHHRLQWSPWSARGTSAADAIAAIDLYAAAVDRWQMGADVVDEIESRVDDLEERERGMQLREREAVTREHGVEARERGVDAREQVLKLRESATQTREQDVEAREQNAEVREQMVHAREQSIEAREQTLDVRDREADVREQNADVREREFDERERNAAVREQSVESREQNAMTRDRKAAVREHEIDAREQWLEAREQNAEAREQSVVSRERNAAVREREIEAREARLEVREHDIDARERTVEVPEPTRPERETEVLERAEQP